MRSRLLRDDHLEMLAHLGSRYSHVNGKKKLRPSWACTLFVSEDNKAIRCAVAGCVERNEAGVLDRVMQKGRHAGIVPLLHTYLSADPPCLEYEYVEGGDLTGLIQEMHALHGGTYIVVTHDIASARRIGEYIALLWRGRIVDAGDAERMFSSDNPFVHQFLSGAAEGPLTMD